MNPKTSDKSKRSPRFRIHHLCMLHFNSCLFRSRKSKKKIRFALRKNLKLKISEFRPTRPHKKTPYRHQRHLHRSTCATSFVYHPLGVYAREAGAYGGEIYKKIDFNLKKIVREFTFFLLKNTKADGTKLDYHVSYSQPFQRLIVCRLESFRTYNSSQKRTK